jgi:hypothetical protein
MASDVPVDGHRIRDQGVVHVGKDQPSGVGERTAARPDGPAALATATQRRSSIPNPAFVYQLGFSGAPVRVVSTKTNAAVDGKGGNTWLQ